MSGKVYRQDFLIIWRGRGADR